MYIKVSWDEDFDSLMMHLFSKYGRQLFTIDGIGDQMDLNKFSKTFFSKDTKTAADVSVDSNANVTAKTSVEYNFELAKPLKKYNSYFLLWKELRKEFGHEFANKAIESQLIGDIYINDFTDVALPYSYHPGTTIVLRKKNNPECIIHTTMESLFKEHQIYAIKKETYEEINLKPLNYEIYEENRWVELERILRHITDKFLYRFESKYGNVFTVTSDHPCILSDESEKYAEDVCVGDKIKTVNLCGFKDNCSANITLESNKAYTIGAMIGDGSNLTNGLRFHQKKASQSSFFKIFKDTYNKLSILSENNGFDFGNTELSLWFKTNIGTRADNKKLPDFYLSWNIDAKYALLSGIIDTDGTVNKKTGVIDIRLVSLGAIQQIAELAVNLNFDRVRTSLVGNYQDHTCKIKQLQPLYRVSFRIPSECKIFDYSVKANKYKDVILKSKNIDGRFNSDEIIKKEKISFNNKYVYDVTTSSGRFYTNGIIAHNCFNFSTFDVALNGLVGISKRMHIRPPKSFDSFIRQVEQFMVYAANSILGATGFADLFIVGSHYVDKIKETGYDGHIKVDDIKTYLSEKIRNFIYTVNWEFRGNQCVTPDTEVLTPTGFKNIDTLKVNDDIYTWKDGFLNINKVQKVNRSHYRGKMHKYSNKSCDLEQIITPNHRILYKNPKEKTFKLDYSENIFQKENIEIPTTIQNKLNENDYDVSDAYLDLLTLFTLFGNKVVNPKTLKTEYVISFDYSMRQFSNINSFASTVIDIFKKNKNIIKTFSCQNKLGEGIRFTCALYDEKIIDDTDRDAFPKFFFQLSKKQLNLVIDHILWFASSRDGQSIFLSNSLANDFQHLLFLMSVNSTVQNNKVWIDDLTKTQTITSQEEIDYDGEVWCPSTEDGIVVYRKNGKIFISGNSPFSNVSVMDKYFLESLVPSYTIDGKAPELETVQMLQEIFIDAMNDELSRSHLTFPVTTACFSVVSKEEANSEEWKGFEQNEIKDKEFLKLIAEKNKKFGFINFYCGETSQLSSCCRLRSGTNNEYFNSFGAGSTKIGSLGVVTCNLPRLAMLSKSKEVFLEKLEEMYDMTAKINNAKRNIIKKRIQRGAAPLYDLGIMDLSKQYSTFGVNGLTEALNILGYDILNEEGQNFVFEILKLINRKIDEANHTFKAPHNVEQVPAENSAVKLAEKDRYLNMDCGVPFYSNQFIPLTTNADVLERIELQGKFDKLFSGGAICHINVDQEITDTQKLIDLVEFAAKKGAVYFAINYKLHMCKNSHMWVGTEKCPVCGEEWEDEITRVVGFFTNVKNWNKVRRESDWPNRQFYK